MPRPNKAESHKHAESVRRIIRYARPQFGAVADGCISQPAFDILATTIFDFIRSLITESERIARIQRSDVVSASHVESANSRLMNHSSGRWRRHLGTIFGALFGASLSQLLSMASADHYSAIGLIVSGIIGVIGVIGLAVQIAQR